MTVLWIVNISFGPLLDVPVASGGWLEAAYDSIKESKDITLVVATVGNNAEIIKKSDGNHTFYKLPGGIPPLYNHENKANRDFWEYIRNENKIDLIQIWGTEYSHSLLALQVFENVPAVVYMQGLISQIARHYDAGLAFFEQIRNITFRDIIKRDWIPHQKRKYEKIARREAQILNIAKNVIVENEWCADHCRIIAPGCHIHKAHLNIRADFYNNSWTTDKLVPYTIMCNAGGYPLKGFHVLLKACEIVVKHYPDARLYVPGDNSPFTRSQLRITGYQLLVKRLITKLALKDNIEFLPTLSAAEMAKRMAEANVFVMPSSIENHSSTLIEAMMVGTPCIASAVGGIPEYVVHKQNALLYRFEEHEILASHIMNIFGDTALALSLSDGAKRMKQSRSRDILDIELRRIYNKIMSDRC